MLSRAGPVVTPRPTQVDGHRCPKRMRRRGMAITPRGDLPLHHPLHSLGSALPVSAGASDEVDARPRTRSMRSSPTALVDCAPISSPKVTGSGRRHSACPSHATPEPRRRGRRPRDATRSRRTGRERPGPMDITSMHAVASILPSCGRSRASQGMARRRCERGSTAVYPVLRRDVPVLLQQSRR